MSTRLRRKVSSSTNPSRRFRAERRAAARRKLLVANATRSASGRWSSRGIVDAGAGGASADPVSAQDSGVRRVALPEVDIVRIAAHELDRHTAHSAEEQLEAGHSTNSSTVPLTDWKLEFDLPLGESVSHTWNSTLAHSGTHYVLTPANWNRMEACWPVPTRHRRIVC